MLQDQIACKQQELAYLQDQLHSNSEWIQSHCDLLWLKHNDLGKVISRISFLEKYSRKYPIKLHGWHYQLDNENISYYFRTGSNWCSEVRDVGNEKERYDLSRDYLMDNCDQNSGVLSQDCLNEIAKLSASQVIGYMFLYAEGW